MPRPKRVAVTGVGHYHAAFYPGYLELLAKHGCTVVGVADPTRASLPTARFVAVRLLMSTIER